METRKKIFINTLGIVVAGCVFFLFFGAASCPTEQQDAAVTITLFHVNDAHSRIDNFAKIAWLVNEEKKKNPAVFFLDAGDNFSGNPIVDQYEPKGQPMRDILNLSGIDALTLGNHDFDYGQEILKKFINEAAFPILCANMKVSSEAVIPQPKPYVILETKTGIKIGILGLIQVEGELHIPSTHPAKLIGLTFSYGVKTAREYRNLKDKCDIFIALTHLGYETDEVLAKEVPEIDIIIGGHSHTLMEKPVTVNNVLITQAGSYGAYLGRIDITLKDGKIIKKESSLIKLDSIKKEDPEIKRKISDFNNNHRLNRIIAVFGEPLKGKQALGNLITDAIREIHHLDIAFHNWGGTRSNRLGREIRLKDIYTLLPFGNDTVQFVMTPAEIRGLIRYDFKRHESFELFVSGISYVVKYTPAKNIKEIELRDEQGKLLDETGLYKVGINDYIVSAYAFTHKDPGKSLKMTIAESLIRYLREGGDVTRGIEKIRSRTEDITAK